MELYDYAVFLIQHDHVILQLPWKITNYINFTCNMYFQDSIEILHTWNFTHKIMSRARNMRTI